MKAIFKSLLAFLVSILPEETKTEKAEEITHLEEAINALKEDEGEPSTEEKEKIENAMKSLAEMGGVVSQLQNKISTMSNKPSNQPKMENHALKTQAYEDKFLAILMNADLSHQERKARIKSLQVENAITGDEVLFPVRIAEGVRSRVLADDTFINKLYHFGKEDFDVPVTLSENDAKLHTKGKTKTDAVIALIKKTLKSEAVYAKLPIDYTTMRKASTSFYAWVVEKLAQIVIETIEKAVLIGVEGITSFTAVTADTTNFATSVAASGEGVTRDDVVALVDAIQYRGNDLTLVVSKPTLSALRREIVATGGTPSYISNTDLAEMLGVNSIITRDYVAKAIVFAPSAYGLVGDTAPEKIEQYDIKVNAQEVELVGVFGGALVEPKSASFLA